MKKLLIIMLSLTMALGASARHGFYHSHVVVVGGGYYGPYYPYGIGFGYPYPYPYYGYGPGMGMDTARVTGTEEDTDLDWRRFPVNLLGPFLAFHPYAIDT